MQGWEGNYFCTLRIMGLHINNDTGSNPVVYTTYSRVHIQHALIADLRNLTFEPSILTLTDHLATREVVVHQLS